MTKALGDYIQQYKISYKGKLLSKDESFILVFIVCRIKIGLDGSVNGFDKFKIIY